MAPGVDGAAPPEFLTAVLVPSQTELQLQKVPLAVAAFPSKSGNLVMRALGSVAPLPDHKHLKRVRKAPDDPSLLETVLCILPADAVPSPTPAPATGTGTGTAAASDAADCTSTSTADGTAAASATPAAGTDGGSDGGEASGVELPLERLPEAVRALYSQHGGVRLRVFHAAGVAPQTRQQWEAWMKLWPITWRIPDNGTPVTEEVPVDARTQSYFETHMRRALELAAAAGPADNAAVIANPPALTSVAEAVDGSAAHPLHHAVMVAIQGAADWDLATWPPSASGSAEGAAADPYSRGGGGSGSSGGQGMEVDGAGPGPAEEAEEAAEASGTGAAGGGGGEELACKRPRLGEGPAAPSQTAPAEAPAGTRPYMCTGYDCFVVREPCIMCAMGLVHSRVQRVIYCRPDAVHGALGGCRRLHACRSLNHNYEVYRMELKPRE
ncbi:hypothetical protein HYH03_001009 [Edaphochlamys debaryana]|uniref:CMP/dCMP-type deaminase domain-containing protein n=1 Tax=Edaphochlamys debaryana TaxID=47281 RepID=A0A835YE45_9CHLO|nr:hypothetical protein HYH03_001009 [Edaphochlamys debaryana]|eukprot:KAG2501195.1 hypothetical protein HYH03_001009 [Edaphochlamys debaryana]